MTVTSKTLNAAGTFVYSSGYMTLTDFEGGSSAIRTETGCEPKIDLVLVSY